MSSEKDFISHSKTDAHNHLNLGMRYSTYAPWAGFYIPNFPRVLHGLPEMHEIIGDYTRPRAKTQQDAKDLISLAIEDAIADGVTTLEGSVDLQFVGHCGNSVDKFVQMVSDIQSKYANKIDFKPELGMGKTFPMDKIKSWVPPTLESGIFKSIDLYGPEVFEDLDDFKPIYELAGKLNIKRKAHVGEFSSAESVRLFIDFFDLEEVQHGIGAAKDEKTLQYLADKKIRCNVTPASNVMLTAVPTLKEHPMRKMYDAGVKLSIGTDDLLFFNRTVSEQCQDLVDSGLFTKEEIFDILSAE